MERIIEPDLSGRLRAFALSDILQLLGFAGQTGTLILSQGWNQRTIVFEQGRLTYITAATRLPTVGELLLQSGRLTRVQYSQAMASPDSVHQGIEAVLLMRGWVTEDDLRACRDQQIEETLYTLFLWRNCTFTFHSGTVEKKDGLTIDLAAERLIMDAMRRVDEWMVISRVVPSVYVIFRRNTVPKRVVDEKLDGTTQRILEMVDGRRDVVTIAKACNLTQFAAARGLYQLVKAGLVDVQPPDKLKIIELFGFLVESIYKKLMLYGHSRVANEFEQSLVRFAEDNGLKVRMRGGRVILSDQDLAMSSTEIIDHYKLFIAIQQNHFARILEPHVVHGLTEGLYLHVDPELQALLQMYEFHRIEGLLGANARPVSTQRSREATRRIPFLNKVACD